MKKPLPISAVIMAGGKGKRLAPLTNKVPKPLLKIGDKTIIEWVIELLLQHHIHDISVSTCYLSESVTAFFEHHPKYSFVKILHEDLPMGDIGVLGKMPADYWQNDDILVINTDLFTDINLTTFYTQFLESQAELIIATFIHRNEIPWGILNKTENYVTHIQEKPVIEMEANAGIYLFKKPILTLIPTNDFFQAWRLINRILEDKNYRITTFPIHGTWVDIGTKKNYLYAQTLAKGFSGSIL
jgi:NDP-sugar pyrophosphorylase family protein